MLIHEPKESCRLGTGAGCCIFLTLGVDVFECEKGTGSGFENTLIAKLARGETAAKGTGDWDECLLNKRRRNGI